MVAGIRALECASIHFGFKLCLINCPDASSGVDEAYKISIKIWMSSHCSLNRASHLFTSCPSHPLQVQCRGHRDGHLLPEAIAYLQKTWPWWNRTRGARHAIIHTGA